MEPYFFVYITFTIKLIQYSDDEQKSECDFLVEPSPPLFLSVLNNSSQEEVSIRDVRILPNLNASYLPMMPDGSVLLVDNVWCVSSLLSALWHHKMIVYIFLPHILLCYTLHMSLLSSSEFMNLAFILFSRHVQPPVRWGRHGIILQGWQPGWPPSQHVECFGGTRLPVSASPQRHATRGLQRGVWAYFINDATLHL